MAELVLLMLGSGEAIRCASLADAKAKASRSGDVTGAILVEVFPEGGGQVETLEFDRQAGDWISGGHDSP